MSALLLTKHFGISYACLAIACAALAQDANDVHGPGWNAFPTQAFSGIAKEMPADVVLSTSSVLQYSDGSTPVTISPELKVLVDTLGDQPMQLFDYVSNNIVYQPYYGSHKGAHVTYLDGAGNDFDQASLLIALLAQAGYQAVYVHGNYSYTDASVLGKWLGTTPSLAQNIILNGGTSITSTSFEHFWVRVTVNGIQYDLDPSFKTCRAQNSIDLKSACGYSRNDLLAAATTPGGPNGAPVATADYVQNLNRPAVEALLKQYAMSLRSYIKSNSPNVDTEAVIGGTSIVQQDPIAYWNNGGPKFYNSEIEHFSASAIPAKYRATLEVLVDGNIDTKFYADSLQGNRLSLVFSSSNAQLYLKDLCVSSQPNSSGSTATVMLCVTHPASAFNQNSQQMTFSRTGSYDLSYSFYPNPRSSGLIDASVRQIQTYIDGSSSDTSREVLTETLHSLGLKWIRSYVLSRSLSAQVQSCWLFAHHTFGRVAQESSYYVDIPCSGVVVFDASGSNTSGYRSGALFASAMEHGVIEQNTSSTAISTIKCLVLANDNPQQKIFKVTANNYSSVSGQLSGYNKDFSSVINLQHVLLIPKSGSITLNRWTGYGYADFSSNTTSMIIGGGGLSGGYSTNFGTLSGFNTVDLSYNSSPEFSAPIGLQPVTSAEPVDLVTGAYTMEKNDLDLGAQGTPRGLTFTRYYDSAHRTLSTALGCGWTHSCEGRVTYSSELDNAFGVTQPTDAVQAIVGALAAGDFVDLSMSPQEMMVGVFAANWAVAGMLNNAANVKLGNQQNTYIKMPDGTWNPPPGSTTDLVGSSGSHVLKPRFGGSISFDAQNRLSQWTDIDGNTETYTYSSADASGRLTTVTDQYKRTLTFNYYASGVGKGLLQNVTDSTGRVVQFSYTAGANNGINLTQVTDVENFNAIFGYDSLNRLSDWKDHYGQTITHNDYDGLDHVYQQLSQGNSSHTWLFGFARGASKEVDPQHDVSEETCHFFDAKNREIRWEKAYYTSEAYFELKSYDAQNHIVSTTDALKHTKTFEYDGNQNCTKATDGNGKSTTYQYDSALNLWKVIDATNKPTTYLYYANHKLLSVSDPGNRLTQYFYRSGDGLLDYVIDFAGNKTSYNQYDAYGNAVNITRADNTTVSAIYNVWGDLTSWTDGRKKTWTYDYYKRRLLKTATDPLTHSTSYVYDSNGNPSTVTDRNSHLTTFVYDDLGHVRSIKRPDTGVVTYKYDTVDRLQSIADTVNGTVVRYDYDLIGQLWHRYNGLDVAELECEYWGNGQLKSVENGLYKQTSYFYDDAGRLEFSGDPMLQIVSYTYDDAGRPLTIVNKLGNTFSTGYGNDGLPSTFTYPTSTTAAPKVSQIVDREAHGLPKTVQDPMGRQTSLIYDGMGRLQTQSDNISTITWVCDGEGHPKDVQETIGSTTTTIHREFDDLGRMQSCTDTLGYSVSCTYDNEGNLHTITYPGNKTVTYTYDGSNRVSNVVDWNQRGTNFGYDDAGYLHSIERSNGTVETLTYDPAKRLMNSTDNLVIVTTDPNSRQVNKTVTPIWSAAYTYYDDNRLQTFNPTPMARTGLPPDVSVTYNADNVPTVYGGQLTSFDGNGNLLTVPVNGSLLGSVVWDARNRLLSANGISYSYDAENRRITSTTNAGTTQYIWLRNAKLDRLLAKVNPDNSVTRYVYGTGLLYEETTAANGAVLSTLFYHFDWRGDTVALTDSNGNVVARMSYSPYGERTVDPTVGSGAVDTPFCFNGQWGVMTEPTGLLCMQARFYSPILCRFLSEDPSGFSGGGNLYAFAGGDPIDAIDPFGLGPINTASQAGSSTGSGAATSLTPNRGVQLNLNPPGTDAYRMAASAPVTPGTFTIAAHTPDDTNSPTNMIGPSGETITPADLSNRLLNEPNLGYKPGQPVQLYVCNAANGNPSIAQSMSNSLQATVTAGNRAVTYVSVSGGPVDVIVANGIKNVPPPFKGYLPVNPGNWIPFSPSTPPAK